MFGKYRRSNLEQLEQRRVLAAIVQVGYFDTWGAGIIPSTDVAGITFHPPSGSLFLADSEINELPVFNGNNVFQTTLNGDTLVAQYVSGNSEPTGITYNQGDGYFYVTNDNTRKITRYDSNLNYPLLEVDTRSANPNFKDPEGITSDLIGNLYVTDAVGGTRSVLKYNSNLEFQSSFSVANELSDAEGIAYNPDNGHLYLVSGTQDKIGEYTLSGTFVQDYDISQFSPAPKAAQGLTFGPTSNPNDAPSALSLYIADGMTDNFADGRIYEANVSGVTLNTPPTANAGVDQAIELPASATLAGIVSDDGLPAPPGAVTPTWSKVSGPGSVTFSPNANALNATASFSGIGSYVLRLTADDGELTSNDEMMVVVTDGGGQTTVTLNVPLSLDTDDVEENINGGVMRFSGDLDIVLDSSPPEYTIGLRFDGMNIPQSASIVNAYVQFQADESQSAPASFVIRGEATDDPGTFTSKKFNVTSRSKTAASVAWNPAAWTKNQSGPSERTANISSIVQESVNRAGWSSGNALAFFISGTGKRTAESFEGGHAPILHVEYSTGGNQNQPPVAIDDAVATNKASVLSGNVLAANPTTPDSDPNGDTLTVTKVNGSAGNVGGQIALPSGALLTQNSNGSFSYDPNGQFDGLGAGENTSDSYTYTLDDGNGGSDTATVNITIHGQGGNQPPIAIDDAVATNKASVLSGNVLAANPTTPDSDPNGDPLTVTQVNGSAGNVGGQITLPSGALLTQNSNGSFSYDPNGQFEFLGSGETAADSYTYAVDDGHGGSDTAIVTITIQGQNGAPINMVVDPPSRGPVGGAYHSGTNTVFVVDDPDNMIYEFSLNGTLLNSISTKAIATGFVEPKGISIDPVSGNLIVADDSGGTKSIYVITTSGQLVTTTSVPQATLNQHDDVEGLSYVSATRTLYVTFSNDQAVGSFHVENNFQLTWLGTLFSTVPLNMPNGQGADGIAFDPGSGNLFLVTPEGPGSTVYEVTTSGTLVHGFQIDLKRARGIDVLSNGHLMITNAQIGASGGGVYEYTRNGIPVSSPILSAVGVNHQSESKSLSYADLASLVAVAADRWTAAGENSKQLEGVSYQIVDLPGNYLGAASSHTIAIDVNAAGHGWFVDSTPEDNSEFIVGRTFVARDDTEAAGRFDLLSVVMHEMGHLLGFADDYNPSHSDTIMYGYIEPGMRRFPTGEFDVEVTHITESQLRSGAVVLDSVRLLSENSPLSLISHVDRTVVQTRFTDDDKIANHQRDAYLDALFAFQERDHRYESKSLPKTSALHDDRQTNRKPRETDWFLAVDQLFHDSPFGL